MTFAVQVPFVVVSPPLTADSLTAYLEQQFPGLAGPNPAAVAAVTMKQFGLAARYPTVVDLDKLFTRTAAARASLEQQLAPAKKLSQIQQLNFALFTGDPSAAAVADFRGVPALKAMIDAAAKLVTG